MNDEFRPLLSTVLFAGVYLKYYWDYANNGKGERAAFKAVKSRLLTGEPKLNQLHHQRLTESLQAWESIMPYWEEYTKNRQPKVDGSLPEIHSFCKIMVNIFEEVIAEQRA